MSRSTAQSILESGRRRFGRVAGGLGAALVGIVGGMLWTAAAAAGAAQAPEIDQLRAQALSAPEDPEVRYLLARELNAAGRHREAERELRYLVERHPQNADYLLALGQSLLWDGRPEDALPWFEMAVAAAPDYDDAVRALGQARAQARPRPAVPRKLLILAAGTAVESLSNSADAWQDHRLELRARMGPRRLVSARIVDSSRFGQDDVTYGAAVYTPLGERFTAQLDVSYSPTHRVLPEHSVRGQLGYSLPHGWGLLGGVRRTEYRESLVYIGDLTVERYWASWRAAYTLFIADSNTAGSATSHRAQLGYWFSDDSSLQVAVTAGSEVEKPVDAVSVIRTDLVNASLWGESWVGSDWGLFYGLTYTDLDPSDLPSFHRTGGHLGLQLRF